MVTEETKKDVEQNLTVCRMALYQLSNYDLSKEEIENRCNILDFHLSNVDKLLGISSEKKAQDIIDPLQSVIQDIENKNK